MPAFATHEIFGEEGYWNLSSEELSQAVANHRNVFHIGCQGPDLFFYNPFMAGGIWEKNLGIRMHETKVNQFFRAYMEALLQLKQSWELETGISYFLGFLSHYSLDAEMHPYIYSKAGYVVGQKGSGARTLSAHQRLEAVVDRQLLMVKRDCMPSAYYPEKKIKISRQELGVIARLLSFSLKQVYHIGVKPENVKASYWCMRTVMRQVYDHSGKRRDKVRQFESAVYRHPLISNMIVSDNLEDEQDAMNQSREVWQHPWEQDKSFDRDIWEMYDDALERYQEYVEAIRPLLTGMIQRTILIEKQKSRAEWVADALREQIPKSVRNLENRNYHSGKSIKKR